MDFHVTNTAERAPINGYCAITPVRNLLSDIIRALQLAPTTKRARPKHFTLSRSSDITPPVPLGAVHKTPEKAQKYAQLHHFHQPLMDDRGYTPIGSYLVVPADDVPHIIKAFREYPPENRRFRWYQLLEDYADATESSNREVQNT